MTSLNVICGLVQVLVAMLVVVGTTLLAPFAVSQDRIWTQKHGETIAGSIEAIDIAIQIRQDDGVLITVPLSQLSSQDQEFVKYYLETNASSVITMLPTAERSGRETLDREVVDDLVRQLESSYDTTHRPAGTLAILPFRGLRGDSLDEGRWIAERLITPFVNETSFQVQERSQIEQLMNDHRLAATGVIDPTSAKRIGQLLGAETLVTGTIEEVFGGKRISARLIGTEDGRILAVATVEVIESSGRRAMLDVSERIATDLAIQVARRHDGNLRLGILTLADLTDENEDITEILADDFTLFLHEEGSIELIERLRLHEVVDESRLTSTGAIGNQAARQVGQTLSVDAVLIGSIVAIRDRLTINARIVSVETGDTIASESVALDSYRETLRVDESAPEDEYARPRGVFLSDDFQNTRDGYLPDDWTGPSVLVNDIDGQRVLLSHRNETDHQVQIGNVEFPINFEIDWTFVSPSPEWSDDFYYYATIGDINLRLWMDEREASLSINDSREPIPHREVAGQKVTKLTLRKVGPVVTAYLNDREIVITRIDEFRPPRGMTLQARSRQRNTQWKFIVLGLEGRVLTDN